MDTNIPEINTAKIKKFGDKLTAALKVRSYERLEAAAEAFVDLFEGESIVAIDKFIEHVRIVYNGIDSYYDTKRIINPDVLNDSKGHRRLNLQNSSDMDHGRHSHE